MKYKNIFVIYGPTGSGKTHLSYELLKNKNIFSVIQKMYPHNSIINNNFQWDKIPYNIQSNTPIINMDSKQIYYNLPILTASPNDNEKSYTYHHLFNFLHPNEFITAHQWKILIMDFIDNTGYDDYIIVGGSSFYLKYLLTDQDIGHSNLFDSLIIIFLNYFDWDVVKKIFNLEDCHSNDFFRKYNYIKNYFKKFSLDGLNFNKDMNFLNVKEEILLQQQYSFKIIVINPDNDILRHNITHRAHELPIDIIQKEIKNIQGAHKNFNGIIGVEYIDYWNMDEFIIHTLQYSKSQKKWINYFLKNKFFNNSYDYYKIE